MSTEMEPDNPAEHNENEEILEEEDPAPADVNEASALNFRPPSVVPEKLLAGETYEYFSELPEVLQNPGGEDIECILGIDEAGRGPVLGPMVYAAFYIPLTSSSLLSSPAHRFDDSKLLTATRRTQLMATLCTRGTPTPPASAEPTLATHGGYALSLLSAAHISSSQLAAAAPTNLNALALQATVSLIRGVRARGVRLAGVFVDTVGPPASHQRRIAAEFPGLEVCVDKKAESRWPVVAAASVCAKVTRDEALRVLWEGRMGRGEEKGGDGADAKMGWGSGYPSDGTCVRWMRKEADPLFGWGMPDCRFSWGTAVEMLEGKKGVGVGVEWREEGKDGGGGEGWRMAEFLTGERSGAKVRGTEKELVEWWGNRVGEEVF